MKVYLDDVRTPPKGWVHAKTADEAIYLFNHFEIEAISLDHDLGDKNIPERDGMTVLCHIERVLTVNPKYPMPTITVHSKNFYEKQRMLLVIEKLNTMER